MGKKFGLKILAISIALVLIASSVANATVKSVPDAFTDSVNISDSSAWQYNRTFYIKENSGNDLTDYQVLINLSGDNFPAEANESGADIRFVDENENVLNYWIEEYNSSAKNAKIWVKVPEIPANGTVSLQMYWGNPSAFAVSSFNDTMQKLQIDPSTVALWHFDEESGSTVYDATANHNDGTIHGATWVGTDGGQWDNRSDVKFSSGSAMQFDGVDDFIDIGTSLSYSFTHDDFTIEAWIKTTSGKFDNEIVAKGGSCADGGYKLITHEGPLRGSFSNQDAKPYYEIVYNQTVNDGNWHHVVFVVKGLKTSNTYAYLYIDGEKAPIQCGRINYTYMDGGWIEVGEGPFDTTTWNISTNSSLGIGYSKNAVCPYFFDGIIDEVMILNKSLSAGEIKAQYERRKYTSPEPTISISKEENKPPIASFIYSPESPIVNQTITFDASSSTDPDGTIVNYEWDFDDGSNATGITVTHSYSTNGTYNVSLTVTDDRGATNTTSKTIIISELSACVYTANMGGRSVSVIAVPAHTVSDTIPVGTYAHDVAVSKDGKLVYVAAYNAGSVKAFDVLTHNLVANIYTGYYGCKGVAITPDGKKVYATTNMESSSRVVVIDTATNTIINDTYIGGRHRDYITISPDGKFAYNSIRSGNDVAVIDTATDTVVTKINVGHGSWQLTPTFDGKYLYVTNTGGNKISVIDTSTFTVVSQIDVGGPSLALIITPDDKIAYVFRTDGIVRYIDIATNTVLGSINLGRGLGHGVAAVSPDGKYAYIAGCTNQMSVLDCTTQTLLTNVSVGSAAIGITVYPPPAPTPVEFLEVNITAPNGGEIWSGIQNITWNANSPIDNLTITICLYDGRSCKTIADNLSNTGSYLWNTTKLADGSDVADGAYKIRIKATDPHGVSGYDLSDDWFMIYNTQGVFISFAYNQTTTEKENATYSISIFNKQPVTDTFDITVKNRDNASVTEVNQSTITIPAWSTENIILNVTDENVGTYNVSLNVTSQNATNEVVIRTTVLSSFDVEITPKSMETSIGGNLTYNVRIANHQKKLDIFALDITGIEQNWFSIDNSHRLTAGEIEVVPLDVSIPDDGYAGLFSINVYASSSNTDITKNDSALLSVDSNPILFDLKPDNDSRIGSNDVLFSWRTSVNSTTELFIKCEDETAYRNIKGDAGIYHAVNASNLSRNKWYDFYVMSNSSHGSKTSDSRSIFIDNGITFDRRYYDFTIERDYDQRVTISVTNTDDAPHELLLSVNSSYDDLIVGFVGEGSIDEIITLNPSERKYVDLAIHAQDAMEEDYRLLLNLTNLGAENIRDFAYVNLHVHHPYINFTMQEVSSDTYTLAKTIEIANYGDAITDFGISASDELKDVLYFQPAINHLNLRTGATVRFDAIPVLTEDFTGVNGSIIAEGAGEKVNLSVDFALPPGKGVFVGYLTEVEEEGDLVIVGNVTAYTNNTANITLFFLDNPNDRIEVTVEMSDFEGNPLEYNASIEFFEVGEKLVMTAKCVSPDVEEYNGTIEETTILLNDPDIEWKELSYRAEYSGNAVDKLYRVGLIQLENTTKPILLQTSKSLERCPILGEYVKKQKFIDWLYKNNLIAKNQYEGLSITNKKVKPLLKILSKVVEQFPPAKYLVRPLEEVPDFLLNQEFLFKIYFHYQENFDEIQNSRFADFYVGWEGPGTIHGINVKGLYDLFLKEKGDGSTSYKKSDWYCTNRPVIATNFDLPSTIKPENVKNDPLIMRFTLPWAEDTYAPHDVHISLNNHNIGNLTNVLPEGHYIFDFDPALLNYADYGVAKNTITLNTRHMNGGHYVISSEMNIVLCLSGIQMPVVATNQSEADEIVLNMSGAMAYRPDFGIYSEGIKFSNPEPVEEETITINATIYNFGALGSDVLVQFFDNGVKIGKNQCVTISPFTSETVNISWNATQGSHNIVVKVNPDRTIQETDYTNNEACKDIFVSEKPDINVFDTKASENPYPSIMGTHNGTIKPYHTVNVSRMYTYPCPGTGGHAEYVRIWNESETLAEENWKGYKGDWHNITFSEPFILLADRTYNYTIRTGSYPQIHHNRSLTVPDGEITCSEFVDVNGKKYVDWIPAIRLE